MATQLADAERIDVRVLHDAAVHPFLGCDADAADGDERTPAARGILTAVLISTPFWALAGFTMYLLL
jgi:hypothetical protein